MAPHGELKKKHSSQKKPEGAWEESTHIKVRNGPSWVDGSSNHLEKLVGSNPVAQTCKKERREWRDDRARDQRYDVRPNGQRRFSMEHTDKTYVVPTRKTSDVRHRSNGKYLQPSPAKNARINKIMYHHQGASSYFCMATQ
jgi:hypothetical protein